MKKLLVGMLLLVAGSSARGDEWVPYVYRTPIIVAQQVPVVQAIQMVPFYYSVPVVPQYVPVTSYQNVLVEHRHHCFFKRYEVVTIPQTVYVPVRY